MPRIASLFVVFAATVFPAAFPVAQVQSHGVSASITSPSADGKLHGVPSSVTSPTPAPGVRSFGTSNSRVIFGNPRSHRRRTDQAAVPVFYPVYIDTSNAVSAPAQPEAEGDSTASADNDALREAYDRGAQDALAELRARQRLSQRTEAAREKPKSRPPAAEEKREDKRAVAEDEAPAMTRTPEPEQPATPGPPTIFVFKDGHKIESQNFAIVGQTLFDFSVKGLHKIRLSELDLDATRKINEDSGTPVSLP